MARKFIDFKMATTVGFRNKCDTGKPCRGVGRIHFPDSIGHTPMRLWSDDDV